jgi:hypothetical protein
MTISSTNITFSSLNTFFGWNATQYPDSTSSSSYYPGTGGIISDISQITTSNFSSKNDFALLSTNISNNYDIGYFKTYSTNFLKYRNINCAGNYYINLNFINLTNFFSIDISFSTPTTNNSYILQISNNTTLTNKGLVIKYIDTTDSNLNFQISWNYAVNSSPDIGVFTSILSFSIPQNINNLYRIALIYDSGSLYINTYTNRNILSINSPCNIQDSTYLWLNASTTPSPVLPTSLIYYGIGIYSQSIQVPVNAYIFNDAPGNVALLIYIPSMTIFTGCDVVVTNLDSGSCYNFGNIFSKGYTSGFYLLTEQNTGNGSYSSWVASGQANMIAQSGTGTGGVTNGIVFGNPLEISTFTSGVLPSGNFSISSVASTYNNPLSRYTFPNKTPFQINVSNAGQYNYNTNAYVGFSSPNAWTNINFINGNGNFQNP